MCGELSTAPISIPLHCCEEGSREFWSEVETEKEGKSVGEGIAKFSFYLSSSYSDLIGNKIISPRWVCFACVSNW